jgi:hypothetical protein
VQLKAPGRHHFVGSSQAERPSTPEAIENQPKSGGSLGTLSLLNHQEMPA